MNKPSLTVILPCYNEQEAIPRVLSELLDFREKCLSGNLFHQIQIIVVDDGSTDGSKKKLSMYPDVEVISFADNRGYGAALKAGMAHAVGDWVGFYDLDSTCHPQDLLAVYENMASGRPAMLCGVRMGASTKMPGLRKLGNNLYRSLVSLLLWFPVKDACSGYRFFHKDYCKLFLEHLPNQLNFTLAMSVFTIRNKLNYVEFPIKYDERVGPSKLSAIKDGLRFLLTIFNYRYNQTFKII